MLIDNYISKTIFKNAISYTLIMAVTIQIAFSIRFIEILVKKYISFGKFFEIMVYMLNQYIMTLLPLGIFLAVFGTYSGLVATKELYILRGVGFSNLRILKSTFKVGFVFTLLSYGLQTTVGPYTWSKFQDIIYFSEQNTLLSQVLRPATFNAVNNETTTFVGDVKGLNVENIFIHTKKKNGDSSIVFAPSGSIASEQNKTKILVNNGSQTDIVDNSAELIEFKKYVFNINNKNIEKRTREETDDYTSYEIYKLMETGQASQNQQSDFWRRVITPWFIFFMAVFGGLAVLLRPMTRINKPIHTALPYTFGFTLFITELIIFKSAEKNMTFVLFDVSFILIFAVIILSTIFIKDWYRK